MKIYNKKMLLLATLIMVGINMFARVRTIQTEREFDQQRSKSNLMVALFYEAGSKREGKGNQEKMRQFFGMYENVSSRKLYDDADIIFTKININNSETGKLANRFAVETSPCFVVFKNGQPVLDTSGKIVQLNGFVLGHELQQFINTYCMGDIKKLVTIKEQHRKERIVKSQEESDPYFYPAVYYAPEYDFSWQKPLKYDAEGNEK